MSLFVYSLVGGGITRTFRPWTHTSDDSYIYQLSLVVATATLSLFYLEALAREGALQTNIPKVVFVSTYSPQEGHPPEFSVLGPCKPPDTMYPTGRL